MTDILYSISVWVVPLVVAIIAHEVAHGYVANLLGDKTAAEAGRLTLNPIRHIDPFGTVILPLMLAIVHAPVFGWAKPVPVRGERLRNPRVDMMLVALAGPVINLFLGALAALGLAFVLRSAGAEDLGPGARFLVDNLLNFLLINVFLAVFNLIPLPPFDGGHLLEGLLPRRLARRFAELNRYAFLILMVLLVLLPMLGPQLDVIGRIVAPIANSLTRFYLGGVGLVG